MLNKKNLIENNAIWLTKKKKNGENRIMYVTIIGDFVYFIRNISKMEKVFW